MNEFWIVSCYSFATCLSSKGYPVKGFDKICSLHRQQLERKEKAVLTETVEEEKQVKEEKEEKEVKQEKYVDPELKEMLEELDLMEKQEKEKGEKQEEEKEKEKTETNIQNSSIDSRRRERPYCLYMRL